MSEAAKQEQHPFEKMREAMRQVLTVSKKEILRREAEAKQNRKAKKSSC